MAAMRLRPAMFALGMAGLLASSTTHAVRVSSDGTGQVLLYPYYTTRSGFVTSVTVVNHSFNHTKAVKVRWREGKIGAPVLDLNVYLSPRDVWVGVITDNGAQGRLTTPDRSCTHPQVPSAGLPFVNSYYTGQVAGTFDDRGGPGLDRTREGYIEVIEMGVAANGADIASTPATPGGNMVATGVKHLFTGVPADCARVQVSNPFAATGDLRSPAGGLGGQTIIINTATGTEFALMPTALQQFFRPADASADLYSAPGSLLPDLTSVNPARSDVLVSERDGNTQAMVTVADWVAAGGKPIDAVSAVLATSDVRGQYDVNPGIKTDLVVTMPTKRYYVLPETMPSEMQYTAVGPFHEAFLHADVQSMSVESISCDVHFPTTLDREAAPYATVTGVDFGFPPPPPALGPRFCYATSVVTLTPNSGDGAAASVFGSRVAHVLKLAANGTGGAAPQYTSGWMSLAPTRVAPVASPLGPGLLVAAGLNPITSIPITVDTADALGGVRNLAPVHTDGIARRYRGLPLIGFTAISASVLGQGYGGIFPIKLNRRIEP